MERGGRSTSVRSAPYPDPPDQRECTRCEGTQHLVATQDGFGKYRCDDCGLVVGFDLDSPRAEFLLDRGLARRYSKSGFGPDLMHHERRLEPAAPPSSD